jgi:hypothetical protein
MTCGKFSGRSAGWGGGGIEQTSVIYVLFIMLSFVNVTNIIVRYFIGWKTRLRRCLDDWSTKHLDTVILWPALSEIVMIQPINIRILRQFHPKVVRLSSYPKVTQFDPSKVGLNVRCDIPTCESAPEKLSYFLLHLGAVRTVQNIAGRWHS